MLPTESGERAKRAAALTAISAGAPHEAARVYAGFSSDEWAELLLGEFGGEVKQAQAQLEVYAAGVLRQAMGTNPAQAKRFLDEQASARRVQELRKLIEADE